MLCVLPELGSMDLLPQIFRGMYMFDADLFELAAFSITDVILAMFGMVGLFAFLVSFLLFLTWGIFQVVRFFRKIVGG